MRPLPTPEFSVPKSASPSFPIPGSRLPSPQSPKAALPNLSGHPSARGQLCAPVVRDRRSQRTAALPPHIRGMKKDAKACSASAVLSAPYPRDGVTRSAAANIQVFCPTPAGWRENSPYLPRSRFPTPESASHSLCQAPGFQACTYPAWIQKAKAPTAGTGEWWKFVVERVPTKIVLKAHLIPAISSVFPVSSLAGGMSKSHVGCILVSANALLCRGDICSFWAFRTFTRTASMIPPG